MRTFIFSILLLIILPSTSCTKQEKMPDLTFMEKLLQENPDSLAFLLEEKINLIFLSGEDRMNYIWWLARTHERQDRSLINDSLIHRVLEHHKETGSSHLFSTYLLAANQAKSTGKITQEEDLLSEALHLAKEKQDTAMALKICSRLGYLYEKDRDKEKINSLIGITKQYVPHNLSADLYLNLVQLYRRSNQQDSIAKYALLGIDTAIKEQKSREEYQLTRAYAEYLTQSGQARKALSVLRDIEHKYPIGDGIVGNEIKFNYITAWIALNDYDSVQACIDNFAPLMDYWRVTDLSTEFYVIESILNFFKTTIHLKQGGTLSTHDLGPVNQIVDGSRENFKAEKERLLAQNKLQKDKLSLEIEKAKLQQHILWGTIALIVIIGAIIFIYQRKLLQKERSLQKIKGELLSKSIQITENEYIITNNEQLIGSLTSQVEENEDIRKELDLLISENEKIKEKNKILQDDIYYFSKSISKKDKELDYLEDLAVHNAKLMERDRFLTTQLIKKTKILSDLNTSPRYIEETQWVEIIHAVDQLFDGFSVRLHIDYPTLTEEDISYCCLFKLRLTNSTISSLMGISPSSVTKRKQRIKEKINQHLTNESAIEKSLEIYLWNYN